MAEAGAGRRVRTDVPMDQGADYAVTNHTDDRAYDANSASNDELGDVLGSLIADLIELGLIGGSVTT